MSAQPLPPLLIDSLGALVQKGAIRQPGLSDAIDGVFPEYIVEPGDEAELARVLAHANSLGLQVAPRGHGTKSSWGNTPQKIDIAISTARLNRVLEHANQDLTVTVEAGTAFQSLQRTLAQRSQRLALDPLWPEQSTIGGIIASNDSGSLRIRYGSIRDLIIGVTVALPDGTLANSGGKVVKNVAGYDLPKLMTGAFGTLGIVTKAVFRLHPLPQESRTVSIGFPSASAANNFMLAVADSVLVPTGTQMRVGTGTQPQVDVRFEGVAAGIDAQMNSLTQFISQGQVSAEQNEVWTAREELCSAADHAVICKVSVLPTQIATMVQFIQQTLRDGVTWNFVAQSIGLALLRIEGMRADAAVRHVSVLRSHLAPRGGTVVVLQCPPEWKNSLDVWGPAASAQPLMLRIKEEFDRKGTLNGGRLLGGI